MSLSLTEINQALKPYRGELQQQLQLERNIAALAHQLASLRENLKDLDQVLAKEWEDVEALSSKWRQTWMKYMEGPDFELQKETEEWEIVRDERQSLIKLIAQIEEQVKGLKAKRQYWGEQDSSLKELLDIKHERLMASPTHDVYQGMVAKEQSIQTKAQLLDKITSDFISLIDHLGKLSVLIENPSKSSHAHRSITYYLDKSDNLLQQLSTQLLQTDFGVEIDPHVLQGFEKQLLANNKPVDWIEVIDRFQSNAEIFLTRLQGKEALIAVELETANQGRQKFLFESY